MMKTQDSPCADGSTSFEIMAQRALGSPSALPSPGLFLWLCPTSPALQEKQERSLTELRIAEEKPHCPTPPLPPVFLPFPFSSFKFSCLPSLSQAFLALSSSSPPQPTSLGIPSLPLGPHSTETSGPAQKHLSHHSLGHRTHSLLFKN